MSSKAAAIRTAKKARADGAHSTSASKRAGLVVGVPRMDKFLRTNSCNARFASSSKITLAAIYEHILSLVMREAILRKNPKTTGITAKNIASAVREDPVLRGIFGDNVTIFGGGFRQMVVPRRGEPHARDAADNENEEDNDDDNENEN